jgi:predicted N-acetyltransferase YhbS
VLLVGDEPYYQRFGFTPAPMAGLWMPGPVDRARFLGAELSAGALTGARGPVMPLAA